MNRSVSLDSTVKDEDSVCLIDTIPNKEYTDSEINKKDLSNIIEKILSKLSYRDRDILRMHYGIGMDPMPNEEIAKYFGIGSERVRQIQHSIMHKLQSKYGNTLKELL